MKVYVFGNEDVAEDNAALEAGNKLKSKLENVEFIEVKPNEDLPFVDEERVVLLDTIEGLDTIEVIEDKYLDKLVLAPRGTAHDYDLGFQLKYLKKLGKLGEVIIIGLPMSKPIDHDLLQSILRKLVAQDMQGS